MKICYGCIGDSFLKGEVQAQSKRAKCGYCGNTRKSISLEELADQIHDVMEEHFKLTPSDRSGLPYAYDSEVGWERSGELVADVITNLADLDEKIAEDVRFRGRAYPTYGGHRNGGSGLS